LEAGHNGINTKKQDHPTIPEQKKIDIFVTMESNMAWHQIPLAQHLPECMQGWWEAIHLSIGYNRKD